MSNFLFYSLELNQLNKMVQISPQAFVVFFSLRNMQIRVHSIKVLMNAHLIDIDTCEIDGCAFQRHGFCSLL